MKKTKTIRGAVSVLLMLFTGPVWAIQGLDVTPGSAAVSARISLPAVIVDPASLPPHPRFRDLFGSATPDVRFVPTAFEATWRPHCVAENSPAASPRGEFVMDGTVVASNNAPLSTGGGGCNGVVPVTESVPVPGVVRDGIVRRILAAPVPIAVRDYTAQALRAALERVVADAMSRLSYRRTWQAAASATGPKTASISLSIGAQASGRIRVNLSRLAAFDGVTSGAGVSVLAGSAPVPVTWTGTVRQIGAGSPLTLHSGGYVLRTRSGTVVGRGGQPLRRAGIRSGRAVFHETIRLTSTQLLRARNGGGLIVERTLTDDFGNSFTARVSLNLTGPSQAPFAVTAMKCHFQDGSRLKIVEEGEQVNVVCELRFDGPGGLLRGTWEIADGGTGQPLFRSLELYSNFVVGQNRVRISRTFTASGKGRHIVRFRVQEPALTAEQVEIQFYVGVSPSAISPAALPSPVSLSSPQANSVARAGTDVSWSHMPPDATHVLIEFFTPDELLEEPNANETEQRSSALLVRGEPIAGLVVPADRTHAEISRLVVDHLTGRGHLYMRVSALEDGVMIGVSPLRRLNSP